MTTHQAPRQTRARVRERGVLLLVENHSVPADRRVWAEAQSLRRAGYRVSVICPRGRHMDRAPFQFLDDVAIYRFPMPFDGPSRLHFVLEYLWAFLACFGLTLRVWRERGFDVIHVGNPPDFFFPFAWLGKLFGKRFVFDQHDLCPETYLSKFAAARKGLLYRALLWAEKRSYAAADLVIATNESYRDVGRTRGGVPEERLYVVRNSPNRELFRPRPVDPALKRGFEHMVCYVGVMAQQDGVDYLLRAAHHVVHAMGRSDVLFILIGTGDAWDDLQRLHAELQLERHVVFTGRIPDEPMLAYLASADLCASPDPCNPLNDVSTMTKLMEFMAMGKAIVSFDLKEARYSAGEAAVYVADNDTQAFGRAIVELLDDPERRRLMGDLGLRRIRDEIGWEKSEEQLCAAYEQILPNGRHAAH
ncbi:MAG: glycosyltransferase family 4 protein [Candidatus Latescibacterota bacterium]|nr:MAG: glycosyltransferase family 4 protein [Candidatus Latescibacterota bacterium]